MGVDRMTYLMVIKPMPERRPMSAKRNQNLVFMNRRRPRISTWWEGSL